MLKEKKEDKERWKWGGHNPRLLTTTANLQYVKKNFFLEIFLVSLRFYMNVDSCEKTERRSM